MEYTVKALAELAGVTPRTLRWYDQKGLLKPRRTTEAGYRLYGPEEVNVLIDVWPVPAPAMPMVSPFRGTAPASP